mgnify:CR=1 FL=1
MTTRHEALAKQWCQWNGQRGTEKQIARVAKQLNESDLTRMLAQRGVFVVEVRTTT